MSHVFPDANKCVRSPGLCKCGSPTGTGSRGQVPFITRWSVIFSTSYAGSCLRGGREKEVFFEGERKGIAEDNPGFREEMAGTSGGLNRNTRCHCVSIQMWAQPVMSFTSPTPPRVIRRATFLGTGNGHKEPPCFAVLQYWLILLWAISDFFFFLGVSKDD